TPHRGSSWAARPVGRFAACLVRQDSGQSSRLRQVIDANPDAFSLQVDYRLPSSIDMLNANNQLLRAIYERKISPAVRYHSVIGTGHPVCGRPSDGVVSVESARLFGADSECYIDATHTRIQRRPETVAEICRILRIHLAEGHSNVPRCLKTWHARP
ncbi:MAG: hypothetical protein JJ992_05220, partial [Planctomycetes bacterium]|nr:hypothetical protein [Planctomycetota bacterium]